MSEVSDEATHEPIDKAKVYAEKYGVSLKEAIVMVERQKVYGDPKENHHNVAQMIAPILKPHTDKIAKGEPIPEWAVALILAQLKMSRMRRVFHEDNYTDITNYLGFARTWQREDANKESTVGLVRGSPEDLGITECCCGAPIPSPAIDYKCARCGGEIN